MADKIIKYKKETADDEDEQYFENLKQNNNEDNLFLRDVEY